AFTLAGYTNNHCLTTTMPSKPDIGRMLSNEGWSAVASYLDGVETKSGWADTAKSFTEWLRLLARESGIAESTLWRHLAAGRYYTELRKALRKYGRKVPSLAEAARNISPESIEILSKISRVAPEDYLVDLATRLIDGNLSRSALRQAWSAYRPVLQGATARGRGVLVPSRGPSEMVNAASALAALTQQPGLLLADEKDALLIACATNVPTSPSNPRAKHVVFDAVVASSVSGRLCLHGIEIVSEPAGPSQGKLDVLGRHCDRIWVVLNEDHSRMPDEIPRHVGILVAGKSGNIRVLRCAAPSDETGRSSGDLARGLLLKRGI
ncbi:MAG: hypothetical protein Q7U75_07675, partial [Desulfobacterales bacterium]|nr:hypothetical protein [Desulfobacterales bacterium]